METSKALDRIMIGCSKDSLKRLLLKSFSNINVEKFLDSFEYRERLTFDFISPLELANLLSVSWRVVYLWIEKGFLPALKLGRKYFMQRKDIEKLFEISPEVMERWQKFWAQAVVDLLDRQPGQAYRRELERMKK